VNFSVFCFILKLHVSAWKQVIVRPVVKICRWLLQKYYSILKEALRCERFEIRACFLKSYNNFVITVHIFFKLRHVVTGQSKIIYFLINMCQTDVILHLVLVYESLITIAKSKIFCISVIFLVFTIKKLKCLRHILCICTAIFLVWLKVKIWFSSINLPLCS
jgi:hypothetical protein